MPASSQSSTVSFAGGSLGSVLSISGSPGSANFTDITSANSFGTGGGEDSRMYRESTCTSVESGTVTVRLLGMPPYARDSIGSRGTLTFTTPSGFLSYEAFLETCEVEASVGELLKGTATFRFTGG